VQRKAIWQVCWREERKRGELLNVYLNNQAESGGHLVPWGKACGSAGVCVHVDARV
jgi:hypothetical protein